MDPIDITNQALVERQILTHVANALREALSWDTESGKFHRKLSTMRFVGGSFQRHLERLQALDEYAGYMELVLETKPHLTATIEQLKGEHDRFQGDLARIMIRLEKISHEESAVFDELCTELQALLDQLRDHNQRIIDLLHSAFIQEEGGMG